MKVTSVQTWKVSGHRGCGNVLVHTKIKIQKFLLKALWPFIQNLHLPKFPAIRYIIPKMGLTYGHVLRLRFLSSRRSS